MMKTIRSRVATRWRIAGLCLIVALMSVCARAWDYDGHRFIAQLALRSLPTNFPAFIRATGAMERVAFFSGEPDRWRNSPDQPFAHSHKPDHFFDLDELPFYGLTVSALSPFRYEAAAQFVAGRAAHAEHFPAMDPARDPDLTRGRIGFLPWAITEHHGRLKSGFSCLRVFEMAGTPEEKANAEQGLLYTMGVMAHFVGDAVQPLHTTRHFNGWVGENPDGYTTNRTFHSWIDGGFPARVGVGQEKILKELLAQLRPARRIALEKSEASRTNIFPIVLRFLEANHAQVRPLYQLDREGRLSARGAPPEEGRAFILARMLEGAQMLGDLWFTAWQDAPPDFYLKAQLDRRNNAQTSRPAVE